MSRARRALRVPHRIGFPVRLAGAAAARPLRLHGRQSHTLTACSSGCHPFPSMPRLEVEILAFWEERGIFAKLRERNAGGPRFSFFDGPVTANKTLGVHTAWGRTLKDVFQRYKALRGFHQRYQNGFDCQGLWIEVGVERELGLNSKREIEEYGLAEFARRCREKVAWSAGGADARLEAPRAVDGLGQRLLHVLGHEHRVHLALPRAHARARLALPRPPLDRVVPALRHVDLAARAGRPLLRQDRPVPLRPLSAARSPRRVARRLDDDAVDASRQRRGGGQPGAPSTVGARTASGWRSRGLPTTRSWSVVKGSALVGLAYDGPFDNLPAAGGVEHRVIPWDGGLARGGHGDRPHRARVRQRGLRALPCPRARGADARSTRPGASTPSTAGCTAREPPRRPGRSSPTCRSAGA